VAFFWKIPVDTAVYHSYNKNMKNALFLIGPPGSGKSTWASALSPDDWTYLSTDKWIEDVAAREGVTYGEVFKREIKNAEQSMEVQLVSALAQGNDIVWDQTNMTRKSRLKKVGRLLDAGYTVDAHVFMPDAHELHQRQFKRAVATGKAIPQRVIDSMMENYEHPLEEEGFASITHHN